MDKMFKAVCQNKPKGCYAFEVKGVHPTQEEMRCFAYSKSANLLSTDDMTMFSFHEEDLICDVEVDCKRLATTSILWSKLIETKNNGRGGRVFLLERRPETKKVK